MSEGAFCSVMEMRALDREFQNDDGLDILVPLVVLDRADIVTIASQHGASGVAQHVSVNLEREGPPKPEREDAY